MRTVLGTEVCSVICRYHLLFLLSKRHLHQYSFTGGAPGITPACSSPALSKLPPSPVFLSPRYLPQCSGRLFQTAHLISVTLSFTGSQELLLAPGINSTFLNLAHHAWSTGHSLTAILLPLTPILSVSALPSHAWSLLTSHHRQPAIHPSGVSSNITFWRKVPSSCLQTGWGPSVTCPQRSWHTFFLKTHLLQQQSLMVPATQSLRGPF